MKERPSRDQDAILGSQVLMMKNALRRNIGASVCAEDDEAVVETPLAAPAVFRFAPRLLSFFTVEGGTLLEAVDEDVTVFGVG